jgi:hypothetical protein
MWFRGLLAIALLGLSIYLLREWYDRATTVREPVVAVETDVPRNPDAPGVPSSDARGRLR